jgi:hypothetical protein
MFDSRDRRDKSGGNGRCPSQTGLQQQRRSQRPLLSESLAETPREESGETIARRRTALAPSSALSLPRSS